MNNKMLVPGAIFLSIFVIGLGVYFYNMAATRSDNIQIDLSSQEATAHNTVFTSYFGNNRSSNEVKSLVHEVTNNNIVGQTGDSASYIYLFYASEGETPELASPSNISNKVKTGKKYWIGSMNDDSIGKNEDGIEPESYNDPSYYSNAYIRIIVINEGGKAPE